MLSPSASCLLVCSPKTFRFQQTLKRIGRPSPPSMRLPKLLKLNEHDILRSNSGSNSSVLDYWRKKLFDHVFIYSVNNGETTYTRTQFPMELFMIGRFIHICRQYSRFNNDMIGRALCDHLKRKHDLHFDLQSVLHLNSDS